MRSNEEHAAMDRVGIAVVALCTIVSLAALTLWLSSETLSPSWAGSRPALEPTASHLEHASAAG